MYTFDIKNDTVTLKKLRDYISHNYELTDGDFILAGRMNDMIKINGNRVEPAEIEMHAKEILGIDWCVAKGFVDTDSAFLCLYYTDDIEFDVIEVKEKFGAVLPYYMVPAYYIKLDKVPLLPNGKINKKDLPKPDTSSFRREYVAPRNEMEEKICQGIEEVLKIEHVGIRDDFFELGGDSLSAMELLAYLDWEHLSATDVYNGITPERIAAGYTKRISASSMMSPEEYEMEARKVPHRLNPTQVYMLDSSLLKPTKNTWNMVSMFQVEDKENLPRLRDAVNEVIKNTPICSTMIYFDDDCELRQRYVPEMCPVVEIEKMSDAEFEEFRLNYDDHTNVINSTLYNFRIFETDSAGYLLINRHHIATDGTAKNLLYQRIIKAYNGEPLPLDTYYSTVQKWEDAIEEDFEADEKYFLERYGDVEWTCGMIPDVDGEGTETEAGTGFLPISLTQEEMAAFEKNTGITRNQLFNIAMMLSVARCTGKKDILIFYYYLNRGDQAGNEAVGCLSIVLPLGIRLGSYRNVAELYDDVRSQTIGNWQHVNHNWADLILPGKLVEDFASSYETGQIMGSTAAMSTIGLNETRVNDDASLNQVGTLGYVIIDQGEGFATMAFYRKSLFSQELVHTFLQTSDAYVQALAKAEDPEKIDFSALEEDIDRILSEKADGQIANVSVMDVLQGVNEK